MGVSSDTTFDSSDSVPAPPTGGGGGVSSVSGTAPIASSGGATPAISLNDTAVTPGAYKAANVTVDGKGRLTAEASGAVNDLSDVDTATDPPTTDEVLKWNGTNWVPAAYNATFVFSILSFSDGISDTSQLIGSGTWSAIGAISFTATYDNAPGGMTAQVAMSGASSAWAGNLAMTPTTGPETNTEVVTYPATTGGTITFTLSQSADGTTDTETVTFDNTMRYGTNANGIGAQTEANIESLTEVAGPSESRDQTISNIPTGTAGHFLTFSHASRLSSVAQVQRDSGFGFVTASFNSTATTVAPSVQTSGLTTVTNSAGYVEAFEAITARLADLTNGTNDFKLLTSSTAINYIYWGESTVASGLTESDIEGNYATQPGKVGSNSMSSRSMVVNATGSEYVYIAYPARLGALTSIVIGGFESLGDFTVDNTALAMTNPEGYTENYRVYVSNNPGFTDPTTMTVTI